MDALIDKVLFEGAALLKKEEEIEEVKLTININNFICPISRELFYDPVVAEDGHIYEKQQLEKWLQECDTSPMTRERIGNNFKSCQIIKNMIDMLITNYPKIKDLQYCPDNSHMSNLDLINKFFKRKEYNQLLKYTHYDGSYLYEYNYLNILATDKTDIIMHILDNSNIFDLIENGYTKLFEYILNKCTNKKIQEYVITKCIYTINSIGHMKLFIEINEYNMFLVLLDAGVPFDYIINTFQIDIINIFKFGKRELIKHILDLNIDVNIKDSDNWSPLHFACYRFFPEIVKILISRYTNLEMETYGGWRPIHAASLYCDDKIIRFLIAQKVDLNTRIKIFEGENVNYDCLQLIQLNQRLDNYQKKKLKQYINMLKSTNSPIRMDEQIIDPENIKFRRRCVRENKMKYKKINRAKYIAK